MNATAPAPAPDPSVETAVNLIAYFEGFAPVARWDVNAYRLGFGSDTEGPDQIKVTAGMTTTRERALQNLMLRVPAFIDVVEKQVGPDTFSKLGVNTIAALASLAYNYGSIPANVLACVTQKPSAVSAAIKARAHDNNGINSNRRYAEAACVALDGGQI